MNEYEVYKMQSHLSALPTITVYSHDYTKMRAEVDEGSIFDVFIQKPLKVIKLWGYEVLILMKMLNFATREKEGVKK